MPQFAHSNWKSSEKSKRSAFWLRLIFLFCIIGSGAGAYLYWPQLYLYFSGNALLRLQKRSEQFEERLLAQKEEPLVLLQFLAETHQFINIAEISHGADPWLYFYRGLFDFYQLLLRSSYDYKNLIELTGRGFVPSQKLLGDKKVSLLQLGRKITINMRKTLALAPNFQRAPTAHLALIYGNLFFTGRTDRRDLIRLEEIKTAQFSQLQQRHHNWIEMVFYIFFGKKESLQLLLQQMKKQGALLPTLAQQNILLCHVHYYARSYIDALRFARRVAKRRNSPPHLLVEAARMEAEIFYIQRGVSAAIPYLHKALKFTEGEDIFIKKRLEQWSSDN